MKKRVEVPQSELFRAVKTGVIHIPIPDDWQPPLTDRNWMWGDRARAEANFPHSQVGYVGIKRYMVNYTTNGQKWSAPSLEVTVDKLDGNTWYWVVVTHPDFIVIGVQNAS